MRFVASVPVGAPFAMSTLGPGARSLRAPARPSIDGRPVLGSVMPGWVTGPTTGSGFDQLTPPSVDRESASNASPPLAPMPKRYALPLLSDRTVHPSVGFRLRLFAAAPTCCCVQVSPPS